MHASHTDKESRAKGWSGTYGMTLWHPNEIKELCGVSRLTHSSSSTGMQINVPSPTETDWNLNRGKNRAFKMWPKLKSVVPLQDYFAVKVIFLGFLHPIRVLRCFWYLGDVRTYVAEKFGGTNAIGWCEWAIIMTVRLHGKILVIRVGSLSFSRPMFSNLALHVSVGCK